MTKDEAIALAAPEAKKYDCILAIVYAPIENAEDESGFYGYCPASARSYMFPYGTLVGFQNPNGIYAPVCVNPETTSK